MTVLSCPHLAILTLERCQKWMFGSVWRGTSGERGSMTRGLLEDSTSMPALLTHTETAPNLASQCEGLSVTATPIPVTVCHSRAPERGGGRDIAP